MVDGTGDEGFIVVAAHHEGELAAHVVCGIIWNGLHHVWTPWGEKGQEGGGVDSQEEGVCILTKDENTDEKQNNTHNTQAMTQINSLDCN